MAFDQKYPAVVPGQVFPADLKRVREYRERVRKEKTLNRRAQLLVIATRDSEYPLTHLEALAVVSIGARVRFDDGGRYHFIHV